MIAFGTGTGVQQTPSKESSISLGSLSHLLLLQDLEQLIIQEHLFIMAMARMKATSLAAATEQVHFSSRKYARNFRL
jgi:hypothetical protein